MKITYLLLVTILAGIFAHGQEVAVVPYPNSLEKGNGVVDLSGRVRICYENPLKNEADYLQKILQKEQGIHAKVVKRKSGNSAAGDIQLLLDSADAANTNAEGYVLNVDQNSITIKAKKAAGIFYGIQTLRQLIHQKAVPAVMVRDAPVFKWRAFMLDEGRYFKGEDVVKDILDEMALLKMNVFHWHLTDDQGWRIEIKKYPKLTKIGGTRKESEIGTWLSNKFDGKVHSGYYTQEQIKDIVRYASERHITIIPEIEMPGHASAAIAAYPWLGTENKPIEVVTRFGIQLNVYNVANARVQQFLHDVLDEVMALFPSNIVHIGGDEVKYDHWKASEEVMSYIKNKGLSSPADLQIQFTNGISNYLEQHGHRMIGWNEILGGHSQNNDSVDAATREKLSKSAIVQFWTGDPETVTKAAIKGHDVINSYWVNTYLDYDYDFTSLQKAYEFNPVPESLPQELLPKVIGLGAQMWGEWIPTVEKMNYQIYPRIAALAEVGWTSRSVKNYSRFRKNLDAYLIPHWESKGIRILPEQLKIGKRETRDVKREAGDGSSPGPSFVGTTPSRGGK